ncbi:DEAD/DEAH box helicase family protein [Halalkalicoccus ordinarius]|uniref:DEAD/DEAH box helicase family protein n=1 Tax=Halalkalicoccus ordinarius TaxID=3116651 RepID=UPI00300ECFCF
MSARLTYEEGTIRVSIQNADSDASTDRAVPGDEGCLDLPYVEYDPRSRSGRAPAFRYADLLERLDREGVEYEDGVFETPTLRGLASTYELRSYQADALSAWRGNDDRGVLELPTGSGKTVIAIKAIEALATPTLVVVPTIDLLEQWHAELREEFDVPIGRFGGGVQSREAITVSTYDSAYLKAESIGDVFPFVIFDEVHHLGGEGYREIARLLAAPARLGLTATFERPDRAHEAVEELLGPVVYRTSADDLAGEHLAPYDVKRIEVELTDEEREAYERDQETFVSYLRESGIDMQRGSDYQELVKRSGSDPRAREALLAKQRAREVVSNADRKIEELAGILDRHRDDRIIVFTAHNDLVYRLSERFLIPAITHRTGTEERREILERFREGTYSRIVASNVLDEGVDVPDANVAVVLSGSGSEREFTQRLGRVLRPKAEGGRALLYELVSRDTAEENVAARRR